MGNTLTMVNEAATRRPQAKLTWTKVRPGTYTAKTSAGDWFAEKVDGEWVLTEGGEYGTTDGEWADTVPTLAVAKARAVELTQVGPLHRR